MQKGSSQSLIDRPSLSEELAAVVRQMVFDGELAAGARINEVHLAERLGVSRTPLREALAALVAEGALQRVPRHGVTVRELTLEEARSIYPIRALLDPEALRLAGIPSSRRLARLEEINQRLGRAADARGAIQLDEEWHRELWADCPNPVLIELIEQFLRRTRRYELASMGQRPSITRTNRAKQEIVGELRAGRLRKACAHLQRNLAGGGEPVFEWLERRAREAREEKS